MSDKPTKTSSHRRPIDPVMAAHETTIERTESVLSQARGWCADNIDDISRIRQYGPMPDGSDAEIEEKMDIIAEAEGLLEVAKRNRDNLLFGITLPTED